ncbi:MAG TPA: hypothetical protein VMI35_01720 [Puia sp.]|nr:hypothetical protein [Puia sp.]
MATAKILYKSFYWKILQFFVSFAVNLLYVRLFQSSLSAEFYSLLYLLSLATSFFTFGLDIGLNYFLAAKKLSSKNALWMALLVSVLAVLVTVLLAFLWYDRLVGFSGMGLHHVLLFTLLQVSGNLLAIFSGPLYNAHGQTHLSTFIAVLFNFFLLVLGLAWARSYQGEELVRRLFLAYFSCSFLQGLFIFGYAYLLYGREGTPGQGGAGLGDILKFSLAAFAVNFIFFAGGRVTVYLLPGHLSAADLGNYIQAFKLVEYITVFASFLYYPLMSIVTRQSDDNKIRVMVLTLVRLSNTAVLVLSVVLVCTGWFLFPLVFGPSFGYMYKIFVMLTPGLFASCASSFFTAYFFGRGRLRNNFISAFILLAAGLFFYFLFVPMGVLTGAACGFSVASLLSLGYDVVVFHDIQPFPIKAALFVRPADIEMVRLFIKRLSL